MLKLKLDLSMLQFRVDALESGDADISTDGQGYGIAKTQFGPFTVSTKAVTPYLDGFKVKLDIGNLTSADFDGAKITISWGLRYGYEQPERRPARKDLVEYWNGIDKSQKKKEFSVTNKFSSGTFTELEVALTPAIPAEVKAISVGIKLDNISLRIK